MPNPRQRQVRMGKTIWWIHQLWWRLDQEWVGAAIGVWKRTDPKRPLEDHVSPWIFYQISLSHQFGLMIVDHTIELNNNDLRTYLKNTIMILFSSTTWLHVKRSKGSTSRIRIFLCERRIIIVNMFLSNHLNLNRLNASTCTCRSYGSFGAGTA